MVNIVKMNEIRAQQASLQKNQDIYTPATPGHRNLLQEAASTAFSTVGMVADGWVDIYRMGRQAITGKQFVASNIATKVYNVDSNKLSGLATRGVEDGVSSLVSIVPMAGDGFVDSYRMLRYGSAGYHDSNMAAATHNWLNHTFSSLDGMGDIAKTDGEKDIVGGISFATGLVVPVGELGIASKMGKAAETLPDAAKLTEMANNQIAKAAAEKAAAEKAAQEAAEKAAAEKAALDPVKKPYNRDMTADEVAERLQAAKDTGKTSAEHTAEKEAQATTTAETETAQTEEAAAKVKADPSAPKGSPEWIEANVPVAGRERALQLSKDGPLSWLQARRIMRRAGNPNSDLPGSLAQLYYGGHEDLMEIALLRARAAGRITRDTGEFAASGLPRSVTQEITSVADKYRKGMQASVDIDKASASAQNMKRTVGYAVSNPGKTAIGAAADTGSFALRHTLGRLNRMINPTHLFSAAGRADMWSTWKSTALMGLGGYFIIPSALGAVTDYFGSKDNKTVNQAENNSSNVSDPNFKPVDHGFAYGLSGLGVRFFNYAKDPVKQALKDVMSINGQDAYQTARESVYGVLKESLGTKNDQTTANLVHQELIKKNFSQKMIDFSDKFMNGDLDVSKITLDQKQHLTELMEYFTSTSVRDKDAIMDHFKNEGLLGTGLAAASAAGNTLNGNGSTGGGVIDQDDSDFLGSMGVDTPAKKAGFLRSMKNGMKNFVKTNPVAAALGAWMGATANGGIFRKMFTGVIAAGIINFVMNLLGISSGQAMNWGKSAFNAVLGPVLGTKFKTDPSAGNGPSNIFGPSNNARASYIDAELAHTRQERIDMARKAAAQKKNQNADPNLTMNGTSVSKSLDDQPNPNEVHTAFTQEATQQQVAQVAPAGTTAANEGPQQHPVRALKVGNGGMVVANYGGDEDIAAAGPVVKSYGYDEQPKLKPVVSPQSPMMSIG